jgi:hypothetical protein
MASWILRDLAQSGDRTFARPLGLNEHAFYWDSQFDRTADCIRHAVVEARADRANDLFGTGNVSRTWASLKQHFPLLGSKFEEPAEGGGSVHFVVIEKTLRDTGPEELHFASIASFKEAEDLVDSLLDGSMECPSNPLAQLYILRRTDQPNYFHIIFRAVHAITDGTSNINILRTFLDILSSPLDSFEVPNLVDRLAMAVSVDELHPGLQSSLSVQRWRRAIVYVLHSIRLSKSKVRPFLLPRVLLICLINI